MTETPRTARQFWSRVQRTDGCWLWTGSRNADGYGRFYAGSDRRYVMAHRFAWEWSFGPIPVGLLVCHHCDTPGCVRPSHLFVGTIADNNRDAQRKGRLHRFPDEHFSAIGGTSQPGELNANAKLTRAAAEAIRASTETERELAERYGVAKQTIGKIRRGERWVIR